MNKLEHAKQLRNITDKHYNCAQSVLVPFAGDMGMSQEQAYNLGAHFGAGMRHGSTCGALSGALMVLGAMGYGEQEAQALLRAPSLLGRGAGCPAAHPAAADLPTGAGQNAAG